MLTRALRRQTLYCMETATNPSLATMTPEKELNVGLRIRAAYLRRGYNRTTFAKALDIHYTTVDSWERGKQEPSRENVALAAEILRVPESELYGYTGPVPEYAAYRAWLETPEGQHASPEARATLEAQRWPKEPSLMTYHYMYQALLAQLTPEQAAKAAETTQEERAKGEKKGGKPRRRGDA